MEPVLSPEQMAAADRRAIAAGTPEAVLIDRAGRAVAWHVRGLLGGVYGRRVVVVVGKGNNGADGRVAAAVLRRWGMGVECYDWSTSPIATIDAAAARADVAIDAMFGTGLRDGLDERAGAVAAALQTAGCVVAVDVPSGVDGRTGAIATTAVSATETICFAAWKPGLLLEPGRAHAGAVTVVDIGIDVSEIDREQLLRRWTAADTRRVQWGRVAVDHKWRTSVLVIGGSRGMIGAPMLAARAAQRAGAGMVVAAVPGAEAAARAAGSEVVVRALDASSAGDFTLDATDEIAAEARRFGSVVIGPGVGAHGDARAAVRSALRGFSECPVVLDADGLNAVTADSVELRDRPGVTVVTPHDGEFERLMGRPVGSDRVASARALASTANAITVLKGPTTVVAAPDGEVRLVDSGGPELATAGTGDVLSGIIAAALAASDRAMVAPLDRVTAAVWLHGRAGCVAGLGPATVASDVIDALASTLDEIRTRAVWLQ